MIKRWLIFFILILAIASCGKKNPSEKKSIPQLPEVTQLFAEVGDKYVKLSWILPSDKNVTKIMIRRKVGESVASPKDGTEIYFGAVTNYVYDRSVSNGVTYYYKVFTSDGKYFSKGVEIIATPRVPPDVTPPGEVYDAEITAGENYVKITWKNPGDPDFAGVVIVKREGTCPQSYEDGEEVYRGKGTFFEDKDVENFHIYCYGIFTYDESGNYSPGITLKAEPKDVTPPPDVPVWYVSPATNQVLVTWVNPDSKDFYQIKIFRDNLLFYSSGGTSEMFIDTTVGPGEVHTYNIKSCDIYDNCTTGYTKKVTIPVTPDTQPPSSVSTFNTAPFPPGNGIILNWKNPPDPDFALVRIYVNPLTCNGTDGELIYQGAATNFTDRSCGGSCINGKQYCYTIYALDGSFNYSVPVTAIGTPEDLVPPDPVTDLTANSDKNGYVTLLWSNPVTADFYGVEIFIINGTCRKSIYDPHNLLLTQPKGYPKIITGDITKYVDYNPPLPADREHLCYAVSSFDRAGNLAPAPATTVTVIDTVPPGSLKNVNAKPQPDGSIFFTWVYPHSPDIAGVRILRRMAESPDDDYFLPCDDPDSLATVSYPGNSFLDITLSGASGAYYNYTFCVYDEWQNYSIPYDITVRSYDSQPPAPVSNFQATVSPEGDEVDLTWNLPGDPDLAGVRILRKTTGYPVSATDPDAVLLFDGMGTQFTDLSVTAGTTYYYAIYAYDYNRNYSSPASLSVTPEDISPPDPVSRVNFADPLTGDVITISWKNPDNSDFAGVTIVRNSSSIPLNPGDGEIVYRGKKEEITVKQPRGTLWYYAFYTSDEVPNYSQPVVVPYYASYVSHITGGISGKFVKSVVKNGVLYILYYSSKFTRGVVLEKLTPPVWKLQLSMFKSPAFISLAKSDNYIWAASGGSNVKLYRVTPAGKITGTLTISGNYDKGQLLSGSGNITLLLHKENSTELDSITIGEDLTIISSQILPGSEQFAATITDDSLVYTYADNNIHLVKVTGTIDNQIIYNSSGYQMAITSGEEGWRILFQGFSPYSLHLLSQSGYSGEVTTSAWYPQFLTPNSFIFYNPNTGYITYGNVETNSVSLSKVTDEVPSSMSATYLAGITDVVYMKRKDGSLKFLHWNGVWSNSMVESGEIFTYLNGVSTVTETFLLLQNSYGSRKVIKVSNLQPVTTDTGILDLASDGVSLYILRKDENGYLQIDTYAPPDYSASGSIELNLIGDNGKLCYNNGLFITYMNKGVLYAGKLTSSVNPVSIGSAISYDVACTKDVGYVAVERYGASGRLLTLYSIKGTETTSIWSTLLTSQIPSYSIMAGDNFIDIFYNNEGISWQRLSPDGTPIASGNYFPELLPALFRETGDGLYLTFRELTRGDLYIGRYIGGNWYFAQVDTIGSPGLYPVIVEREKWMKIYYIVDGAVYRGMVGR